MKVDLQGSPWLFCSSVSSCTIHQHPSTLPITVTHLTLASLTRIRGRARSSRKRWLCSFSLRSLSSDDETLGWRLLMVASQQETYLYTGSRRGGLSGKGRRKGEKRQHDVT